MLCIALKKTYNASVVKLYNGAWVGWYTLNGIRKTMNMSYLLSEEQATKEFSRFLIEIFKEARGDYNCDYDDYYDYGEYDYDEQYYD